jgi:nitrite reductase/ring-hydroxylating ferredoxin subunit
MAWRKDAYMNAAGTLITCHAHGALFLPDTGLCIQGPCRGQSLTGLAMEIDSQGEVFVQAHAKDEQETRTWQR